MAVSTALLCGQIDYFAVDPALHRMAAALRAVFPVSVSVLTNAIPGVKASHPIGLACGIAGLGNSAGPLIGSLLTEAVGPR